MGSAHKLKVAIFLAFSLLASGAGSTTRADTITTYTINFTTTFGPAPTSGSFTYDSTTPGFTNFLVVWNGVTFDLTSSANSPLVGATGCAGEAPTPAYAFSLLTRALVGCTVNYFWLAASFPFESEFLFEAIAPSFLTRDVIFDVVIVTPNRLEGFGSWGSTISPVPEPATVMLLGSGLLALWGALRRRLA